MSSQTHQPNGSSPNPLGLADSNPVHGGIIIRADTHLDGDMVGGDKHVRDVLGSSSDLIGGDKIVEQDAGDSHDEIHGNKYVSWTGLKIGTFVLPIRFLVALLVIGAISTVAAWWYFVPVTMPFANDNIAIAEFGQLDAAGNISTSPRGTDLSKWLFTRMRGMLADKTNLPPDEQATIWHDSMNLWEKRANIGLIRDEAQAAKIADQLNAHIVVYGNLQPGQDLATFVPLFYVNQKLLAQKTGEADELTGTQQLGRSLAIQYPLNNAYLNLQLEPRGRALVWLVNGIGYDLVGEYDHAYQIFCEADQVLNNWKDNQGKEVLYYFLGREALFLARSDDIARETLQRLPDHWGYRCKPFQNAAEANQAAATWFKLAQDTNPDYSRAYFGLGQTFNQRANNVLRTGAHDAATLGEARQNLNDAIAQYQTALDQLSSVPTTGNAPSFVDLKTRAALATSYLMLGQTYLLESDWTPALANYSLAEKQLAALVVQGLIPDTEQRLLAQTNLALASVRRVRAHVLHAQAVEFTNGGHPQEAQATTNQEKLALTDAVVPLQACLAAAAPDKTVDEFLQTDTYPKCQKMFQDVRNQLAALP